MNFKRRANPLFLTLSLSLSSLLRPPGRALLLRVSRVCDFSAIPLSHYGSIVKSVEFDRGLTEKTTVAVYPADRLKKNENAKKPELKFEK